MAAVLPDVIDEDILCCPLCLRQTPGVRPKVLPCLHLFCARCLEDYVVRWEAANSEQYLTFPDSAKGREHFSFSDADVSKARGYLTLSDVKFSTSSDSSAFSLSPLPARQDADGYLTPADISREVYNRRSGASDVSSTDRKRFQQPERYTNRDALMYHGAVYREKYRASMVQPKSTNADQAKTMNQASNAMSSTQASTAAGQQTSHQMVEHSDQGNPLRKDSSNDVFHQNNYRPDTLPMQRSRPKQKNLSRAMSVPQHLFSDSSATNLSPSLSSTSLAGRVTNIIHLYEQKTEVSRREQTPPFCRQDSLDHDQESPVRSPPYQHSMSVPAPTLHSQLKENRPPLASFRAKSQEEASKQDSFVPLSQRPLPEPKAKHKRGLSVDTSVLRSISEASCDSAIGTADSDQQLIFVGAPKVSPPPIPVAEDDDHYESIEVMQKHSKGVTQKQASVQQRPVELRVKSAQLPPPMRPPSALYRKKLHHSAAATTTEDQRGTLHRSESHVYDEISIPSLSNKMKRHGSVPDLLADVGPDQAESQQNRRQSRLRRNSTDLDSFVMVSESSSDLGQRIPLSSDDSQRLSNMYMRMDGVGRPSVSLTSYVAMDNMPWSPTNDKAPGSPNVFIAESVETLIRSISEDFKKRESVQFDLGTISSMTEQQNQDIKDSEPEEPTDPPIYANTKQPTITEEPELEPEPELDMPIPIYETAKIAQTEYYNSEKPAEETTRDLHVPCPTCHRAFCLPGRQVAALQDCVFASQLQEVVETQKCERKMCGHCDSKSALYKCLDCELYLCPGCHQGHSWQRSNRGHRVVTLQELQSGKYQTEIKQLQVTKCHRCEGSARHFCAQCDASLCADCVLSHSVTHQSRPLEDVAAREQDYVQAMAATLTSRKDVFHGAHHNLSTYQQHTRDQQAAILDRLRAQQQYLHAVLDRSFDFLRSKVESEHDVELAKAEALKSAAQGNIASMDYVLKFVRQITEHGNPGNIVAMATMIKQEISRLQVLSPRVMESQMTMSYEPTEVMAEQLQPFCGSIKSDVASLPSINQNGFGSHSNNVDLVKQHTLEMELLGQFRTKLDNDTKGCRPNGVAIAPDEDVIVVVDAINKKLKAFDFSGKFLWDICPEGKHILKDPWDVTFLDDGNLAVTDKGSNDIKIFSSETGEFVSSFGAHLKKPWGISTNSRGEILVTDTELRKVFVHDSNGNLKYSVPNNSCKGQGQFTLKCPEYVCSNNFDDIVISDFENHRIVSFDSLGRPLFKFGKKGKGMDEFHYPLGVATDSEGNIFVVNYQNQRVTVVNRNGHFLCCLTSKGVTLQSLQTLAVSNQGHLVTVDGSWVKIFKLPQSIMGNAPRQQSDRHNCGAFIRLSSESISGDRTSVGKETTV